VGRSPSWSNKPSRRGRRLPTLRPAARGLPDSQCELCDLGKPSGIGQNACATMRMRLLWTVYGSNAYPSGLPV